MKVKDLDELIDQLKDIRRKHNPEMEVAFTDRNCWRSLLGETKITLGTQVVEVKRYFSGYAPLSVINGPRGYMEDCTKELLAKPTLKVVHIAGLP